MYIVPESIESFRRGFDEYPQEKIPSEYKGATVLFEIGEWCERNYDYYYTYILCQDKNGEYFEYSVKTARSEGERGWAIVLEAFQPMSQQEAKEYLNQEEHQKLLYEEKQPVETGNDEDDDIPF